VDIAIEEKEVNVMLGCVGMIGSMNCPTNRVTAQDGAKVILLEKL
jgi:hypothetical protein